MTERSFERLRALFERARDVPPAERDAFLAECEADEALREEVRRLLEESDAQDGFMEPGLPPGTRLGDYEVVRQLGSGGMGIVYEAMQERPRRRVALKSVWPGPGGAEIVRRFRREAELMAKLRHPAIAEVFASGVERLETSAGTIELPWLAMAFVEGARSLTDYAREHGLDERRRISILADVCAAVQHGHSRGVLHRDLKPENVLVDTEGRPVLIDFGVARAAYGELALSTLRTEPGALIGTLAYMSPEQVGPDPSEVDVRSDVYALGAILHELLTGEVPHRLEGLSLPQAARVVGEGRTRRPSELRPGLRGDVEAVLLKALAPEPERRYPTAQALEQDLRQLLAEEPVSARTPSTLEQLGAFARRNRAVVAGVAAVLVVSVGAAAVSLFYAGLAARSAADHRELFRRTLDRSIETVTETVGRVHQLPGGADFARTLLEDSLLELEALHAQAGDDPEVELRIATAEMRLGDVLGNPTYANLGDLDAAEVRYERARSIVAELPQQDPDVQRLDAFLERRRAHVAMGRGDDEAATLAAEASRERFESIFEAAPDDPDAAKDLAFAHDLMAVLARSAQDIDAMEAHVEREQQLFERFVELGGDADVGAFQAALALLNLGAARYARGSAVEREGRNAAPLYAAAAETYARAADELEALTAARGELLPRRERQAWARMWEGSCAYLAGDLPRGETALRRAHDLYDELVELDRSNTTYPPAHANVLHMLGSLEVTRADRIAGEVEERSHLERAAEWRRRAVDVWRDFEASGHLLPQHQGAYAHVRGALGEVEARLAAE